MGMGRSINAWIMDALRHYQTAADVDLKAKMVKSKKCYGESSIELCNSDYDQRWAIVN